jgi:hypothetical protein
MNTPRWRRWDLNPRNLLTASRLALVTPGVSERHHYGPGRSPRWTQWLTVTWMPGLYPVLPAVSDATLCNV